jgi:hypothetical protein
MLPFLLAPLLSSAIAPAATSMMASAGLGSLAPIAGGAATGALTSGLMGGDPITGALTGGVAPGLSAGVGALADGLQAGTEAATTIAQNIPAPDVAQAATAPMAPPPGLPPNPVGDSSTHYMNYPTPTQDVLDLGWQPGQGFNGPAGGNIDLPPTPPNYDPSIYAQGAVPDAMRAAQAPMPSAPMATTQPSPQAIQPLSPPPMASAPTGPTTITPGGYEMAAAPQESNMLGGMMGWLKENPVLGLGLGAMLVDQVGNLFGDDDNSDGGSSRDRSEKKGSRTITPAPSGYRHGKDPEWNFVSYDRGFAEGGEVKDSGRSSPLPSFMSMGLGNMLMNRMQNPLEPFELLSQGKVGKAIGAQFGFADGGEVEGNEVDMAIGEAIEALSGRHPNPDKALERLRELIGDELFDSFMMNFSGGGGAVKGQGGGQDDMVPAVINGARPAALSDGEFVIPADVVSGLGDGSTDAGVAKLSKMLDDVRASKGAPSGLPPKIDERIMPN